MILKIKSSCVLLLLLSTLSYGFQGTDWVKFSSPEGRFSVLMPAEPKVSSETANSPIGAYTNHYFTVTDPKGFYLAGWVDYQPSVRLNVQGEINANRDNFVKGLNAKVLSETAISLGGNPGIEFTCEDEKGFYKSRIYVVGQRPYMLVAAYPKGAEDFRAMEKFLTSFELKTAPDSGHP